MSPRVFGLGMIVFFCGIIVITLTFSIFPTQIHAQQSQTVPESQTIMDYSVQMYGPSINGQDVKSVQVQMGPDQTLQYSFSISSADSSAVVDFSIIVPQSSGPNDIYYEQTGYIVQGSWSPQNSNTYTILVKNDDPENSWTLGTINCNVTKTWTSSQTQTTLTNSTKAMLPPEFNTDGIALLVLAVLIMCGFLFMGGEKSQIRTATEDKLEVQK